MSGWVHLHAAEALCAWHCFQRFVQLGGCTCVCSILSAAWFCGTCVHWYFQAYQRDAFDAKCAVMVCDVRLHLICQVIASLPSPAQPMCSVCPALYQFAKYSNPSTSMMMTCTCFRHGQLHSCRFWAVPSWDAMPPFQLTVWPQFAAAPSAEAAFRRSLIGPLKLEGSTG